VTQEEDRYRRYYEVLEVPFGAGFAEVNRAYRHLRELYSTESIVTQPLENELAEGQRQEILEQVEEAYAALSELFRAGREGAEAQAMAPGGPVPVDAGDTYFTGEALRRLRERAGVELHDIELSTKISAQHLRNMEEENFEKLPETVFVRGYLKSYARHLGLDADKVANDYMARYADWKWGDKKQ
jgi:curved DNA-binding protein CbpA